MNDFSLIILKKSLQTSNLQTFFLMFLFLHFLQPCFCRFHHDGAFDTFLEQLAAGLICSLDAAGSVVRVSSTASGAIKFCPAVIALGA